MELNKKIGEVYGLLLRLEEEYEAKDDDFKNKHCFYDFAKSNTVYLFEKAFEWLVDDAREKQNKCSAE